MKVKIKGLGPGEFAFHAPKRRYNGDIIEVEAIQFDESFMELVEETQNVKKAKKDVDNRLQQSDPITGKVLKKD